jgi:ADP-ribosylation factor-like protein 6
MSVAFSVLCVGLDNAGKTTLCRNLSNSNRLETFPTPNLEIHYVNCPKISKPCLIYDVSGNGRHRDNWKIFYPEVQAIIYVIDASD